MAEKRNQMIPAAKAQTMASTKAKTTKSGNKLAINGNKRKRSIASPPIKMQSHPTIYSLNRSLNGNFESPMITHRKNNLVRTRPRYPRTLNADLELIGEVWFGEAEGVLVFWMGKLIENEMEEGGGVVQINSAIWWERRRVR